MAARGATATEISRSAVHRSISTIRAAMRSMGFLRSHLTPLQLAVPFKTLAALEGAARRGHLKVDTLAIELLDAVCRHGSVDQALRDG
jgi:hypothetical protein